MGARWDQHLLARVATVLMISADQLDASQLALRAGRGLETHRVHPADLGQTVFEIGEQL